MASPKKKAAPAAIETKAYTDGTTVTGTPPLPEQSPAQQDAQNGQHPQPSELVSAITDVAHARALPVLPADTDAFVPVFAEGSIERFMDEDAAGERSLAAIVHDAAGVLHKVNIEPQEA